MDTPDMPTPDCFEDMGRMKAEIEALQEKTEKQQQLLDEMAKARARIGGVFWAFTFVASAALATLAHLFDFPAMVKKILSL